MARLKHKQSLDIVGTNVTSPQYLSGSLESYDGSWKLLSGGTIFGVFSGSGALLSNIPASAIVGGVGDAGGWKLVNSSLFTSESYSVSITGSLTVKADAEMPFQVTDEQNNSLFSVSSSGLIKFQVNVNPPALTPIIGSVYFTSQSLFLGLE